MISFLILPTEGEPASRMGWNPVIAEDLGDVLCGDEVSCAAKRQVQIRRQLIKP